MNSIKVCPAEVSGLQEFPNCVSSGLGLDGSDVFTIRIALAKAQRQARQRTFRVVSETVFRTDLPILILSRRHMDAAKGIASGCPTGAKVSPESASTGELTQMLSQSCPGASRELLLWMQDSRRHERQAYPRGQPATAWLTAETLGVLLRNKRQHKEAKH